MVAGAIAGNISAEATTPTGNIFAEAMRGNRVGRRVDMQKHSSFVRETTCYLRDF